MRTRDLVLVVVAVALLVMLWQMGDPEPAMPDCPTSTTAPMTVRCAP